ncbi:hypothetical protein P3T76_010310 [Phytophthora citrophthora]|uniref:RxLR effector protein n=1 Tax=Phytophthora citrophthora TaxID=4793 RepID=A0AAD9LGH2_9STRA|nr:hypothetical protein P3T76_010310 [Phytophthora citrophthora]
MRLTYIVFVATAAILACCDGSSAKRLAVPQSHVQTQLINNRSLRVHQDPAVDEEDGDWEGDDEERAAPQLTKSLSEKFLIKAAEKVSSKLTRSKSLIDLSKLDDSYYFKALKTQDKTLLQRNDDMYQRIEKMGFNPDGMLTRMKEMDGKYISLENLVLLGQYKTYWKAKYPTWTSKLKKIENANS